MAERVHENRPGPGILPHGWAVRSKLFVSKWAKPERINPGSQEVRKHLAWGLPLGLLLTIVNLKYTVDGRNPLRHHPKNPGMNRVPCKYPQTMSSHGFEVVQYQSKAQTGPWFGQCSHENGSFCWRRAYGCPEVPLFPGSRQWFAGGNPSERNPSFGSFSGTLDLILESEFGGKPQHISRSRGISGVVLNGKAVNLTGRTPEQASAQARFARAVRRRKSS